MYCPVGMSNDISAIIDEKYKFVRVAPLKISIKWHLTYMLDQLNFNQLALKEADEDESNYYCGCINTTLDTFRNFGISIKQDENGFYAPVLESDEND